MLVLAHRGASRDAPENTPAAFRLAELQGADGVELDVRLHRSGSLLVRHDPFPLTDDADAAAPAALDDVLDACGERMLVNVEIKNLASDGGFDPTMTIVERTIDRLRRRGEGWNDRWLISSFSWATIQACRRLAPEIPTALLCTTVGTTDDRTDRRGGPCGDPSLGAEPRRSHGRPLSGGWAPCEHLDVQRPRSSRRAGVVRCRRGVHRRARHRS